MKLPVIIEYFLISIGMILLMAISLSGGVLLNVGPGTLGPIFIPAWR